MDWANGLFSDFQFKPSECKNNFRIYLHHAKLAVLWKKTEYIRFISSEIFKKWNFANIFENVFQSKYIYISSPTHTTIANNILDIEWWQMFLLWLYSLCGDHRISHCTKLKGVRRMADHRRRWKNASIRELNADTNTHTEPREKKMSNPTAKQQIRTQHVRPVHFYRCFVNYCQIDFTPNSCCICSKGSMYPAYIPYTPHASHSVSKYPSLVVALSFVSAEELPPPPGFCGKVSKVPPSTERRRVGPPPPWVFARQGVGGFSVQGGPGPPTTPPLVSIQACPPQLFIISHWKMAHHRWLSLDHRLLSFHSRASSRVHRRSGGGRAIKSLWYPKNQMQPFLFISSGNKNHISRPAVFSDFFCWLSYQAFKHTQTPFYRILYTVFTYFHIFFIFSCVHVC